MFRKGAETETILLNVISRLRQRKEQLAHDGTVRFSQLEAPKHIEKKEM